jgi:deoxyribodipyrimidine photolyase-related protein
MGARLGRGEVLQRRLQGEALLMSTAVFVLPDQLTESVGPVAQAIEGSTSYKRVFVLECVAHWKRPRHIQALVSEVIAARGYVANLKARGLDSSLLRCDEIVDGFLSIAAKHGIDSMVMMEPASPEQLDDIRAAATAASIELTVLPNELWITNREEWDAYRTGRRELRMEQWYRRVRAARGWLMEQSSSGSRPIGGAWNFDAENRKRLPSGSVVPSPPKFGDQSAIRAVAEEVSSIAAAAFGTIDEFRWPTSRREAVAALEDFCTERLPNFGPYEDAISSTHDHLYHSILSGAINLGLLTPEEVCLRAIAEWSERPGSVPLQSIEGFIRQILGWREFMHHSYVDFRDLWRSANSLAHEAPLPAMYWSGETKMACISRVVRKVRSTGYAHHIERLMLLGNFALLLEVVPQKVDAWFLEAFVDAYPWVVTPNVVAMSQFADLGMITSKPYIAGGAYVSRMGDDCRSCAYDPKQTSGPEACPLSTLYWSFVDRHARLLSASPRTVTQVQAWEKRDDAAKAKIRTRAEEVRRQAAAGLL